jgi:hypothetical protein
MRGLKMESFKAGETTRCSDQSGGNMMQTDNKD